MYNENKITNSLNRQQLQKKRIHIKLCVGICVYPLSSLEILLEMLSNDVAKSGLKLGKWSDCFEQAK